jgi:hypothetical protein
MSATPPNPKTEELFKFGEDPEVNTDPFTIQRIAGHSSITMSQRYVHPTPERLEDAFARLETYNQTKVVTATAKAASAAVN